LCRDPNTSTTTQAMLPVRLLHAAVSHAGTSSFGMSGVNAHAILAAPLPPPPVHLGAGGRPHAFAHSKPLWVRADMRKQAQVRLCVCVYAASADNAWGVYTHVKPLRVWAGVYSKVHACSHAFLVLTAQRGSGAGVWCGGLHYWAYDHL